MSPHVVRNGLKRILMGPAVYALILVLCFISVWISLALYVLVPIIYILPGGIDRHLRTPAEVR